MRRHVRTVRRKRLVEVLGERDGVGVVLPGLACGLVAIGLSIFAVELGRSRARGASPQPDVAQASSRSSSSRSPSSGASPVGSAALAGHGIETQAVSAQRGER